MGFVRRHRLALELGLLALVAYLAAVGVTTGLGTAVDDVPPAPAEAAAAVASHAPAPLADYALIAERDVFNPARGGGNGPSSPARLRLWGVGLQGREARAVIEDTATHRQELYRVGDQVGGGARIASIDWDRVSLEGDGGEEVLELSPPAAAPSHRSSGAGIPCSAPISSVTSEPRASSEGRPRQSVPSPPATSTSLAARTRSATRKQR